MTDLAEGWERRSFEERFVLCTIAYIVGGRGSKIITVQPELKAPEESQNNAFACLRQLVADGLLGPEDEWLAGVRRYEITEDGVRAFSDLFHHEVMRPFLVAQRLKEAASDPASLSL